MQTQKTILVRPVPFENLSIKLIDIDSQADLRISAAQDWCSYTSDAFSDLSDKDVFEAIENLGWLNRLRGYEKLEKERAKAEEDILKRLTAPPSNIFEKGIKSVDLEALRSQFQDYWDGNREDAEEVEVLLRDVDAIESLLWYGRREGLEVQEIEKSLAELDEWLFGAKCHGVIVGLNEDHVRSVAFLLNCLSEGKYNEGSLVQATAVRYSRYLDCIDKLDKASCNSLVDEPSWKQPVYLMIDRGDFNTLVVLVEKSLIDDINKISWARLESVFFYVLEGSLGSQVFEAKGLELVRIMVQLDEAKLVPSMYKIFEF